MDSFKQSHVILTKNKMTEKSCMQVIPQTHFHHKNYNLFTVFSKIYFDLCSPKTKNTCFKTYFLLLPLRALVCVNSLAWNHVVIKTHSMRQVLYNRVWSENCEVLGQIMTLAQIFTLQSIVPSNMHLETCVYTYPDTHVFFYI
jgi:hypothetical protein